MKVLLPFFLFFYVSIAYSNAEPNTFEPQDPLESKKVDESKDLIEIDGLIIDRTLTRLGRDFYIAFSMKVNSELNDIDVNLTVKERPTALSGSIVGVYHFDRVIYRSALSPGQRQAAEKAEQALEAVQQYIVKWQIEKFYKDTFDLEHSEI